MLGPWAALPADIDQESWQRWDFGYIQNDCLESLAFPKFVYSRKINGPRRARGDIAMPWGRRGPRRLGHEVPPFAERTVAHQPVEGLGAPPDLAGRCARFQQVDRAALGLNHGQDLLAWLAQEHVPENEQQNGERH